MSSFFYLELDRTPPTLEIVAPEYTTQEIYTDIVIRANELLSTYQEFYIVDSLGNRKDCVFTLDGNRFVGSVNLSDMIGVVTLYARVKDEVLNASNLVYKEIFIFESAGLTVSMKESCNVIITKEFRYIVNVDDFGYNVLIGDTSNNVGLHDKILNVTSVKDSKHQ